MAHSEEIVATQSNTGPHRTGGLDRPILRVPPVKFRGDKPPGGANPVRFHFGRGVRMGAPKQPLQVQEASNKI